MYIYIYIYIYISRDMTRLKNFLEDHSVRYKVGTEV